MQIYARQDAKQCSEPEVPLLFSPFFEAALNHCKSALASAPLYAAPATADAKPPLARPPAGRGARGTRRTEPAEEKQKSKRALAMAFEDFLTKEIPPPPKIYLFPP